MNKTTLEMVQEFHETYGLPVEDEQTLSSEKTQKLRINLLAEELDELKEALADNDPIETLDALIDLQYRSNMSKLGEDGKPIRRESDGKVMKGPNYFKPDMTQFITTKKKAA